MRFALVIDAMASRYGCLPSEIISRADTFDLCILNTMLEHEQYQQQVAEAKDGKRPMPSNLSQEQMKAMIAKARSKQK